MLNRAGRLNAVALAITIGGGVIFGSGLIPAFFPGEKLTFLRIGDQQYPPAGMAWRDRIRMHTQEEFLMLTGMNVCRICVVCICVLSPDQTWSQDSTTATPATETTAPAKEEIPFSVLQQIVSGFRIDGEIRTDLSKEQIEAMKKAQQSHYASSVDLNKLSSLMFTLPGKNRRFNEAIATLKAEKEAELHKEWLSLITPEQQASIRRKNRKVMLQASLQRQQSAQTLLYGDESLDALLTNNDLLSVVERPAVQDILELTDEQFGKIEELRLAAAADAVSTLRQAMKFLQQNNTATPVIPNPSPAWEQLNSETLKILTPDQVAEYTTLKSNPAKMQDLLGAGKVQTSESIFSEMMPHGVPTRVSTSVVDGKVEVTAEFNNAFTAPAIAMVLKLKDEQQKKIAELLDNSRDGMLAEMAARTEAWNNQQGEQTNTIATFLKTHNEKFHAQAVSLMMPSQMEELEKERLRGIGLWALKKPEVRSALELTDEQVKAIEASLSRRAPEMEVKFPRPGGDFQKESEEFHKSAREHSELVQEHFRKQNQHIKDLLSETQRSRFTEMTGHQFPNGPSF